MGDDLLSCRLLSPFIKALILLILQSFFFPISAVKENFHQTALKFPQFVAVLLVSLEFSIDIKSFRSHYGPGVDSTPHRNEYQEYFLGVKGAGA